jgi:ABC-type bacteriocin/lantibiotic exporter with double-glycine peptidase domain
MKIPVMVQMQRNENGATALCMILGYYKRFVPIKEMREICVSSRNGSSPEQILRAAEHYGLLGTIKSVPVEELKNQTFPVMIIWKRRYYALIQSIRGNVVTLIDPASGIYKMDMQKLAILYSGTMICFQKTPSFETGGSYASLGGLLKNRLRPIFAPMISMLVFTVVCVGLNLAMGEKRYRITYQKLKSLGYRSLVHAYYHFEHS